MEVIILVGAIQAVFFAVLVFSKKSKSVSDKVLILWLLLFACHFAFTYYSYLSGHAFYIEYGHIPSGILVIYYTLMYVYAESLINKENVFKRKWLLHLIPTAIVYCSIIPLAQLPYNEKVKLVTHLEPDLYLNIVFGITLLFVTIYLTATLRLLKRHKVSIRKLFSFEENINLNWLRILAILLVFLWVIFSGLITYIYSTPAMQPEEHMILDIQGQFAFVAFVFLLGYFGIKQQVIYSAPLQKTEKPEESNVANSKRESYKKSGLKKEDSAKYLEELLQYMQNEKPYLNGKLSLKDVADKLQISTNHLSQVINETLGKNFFDFVNSYRVELVKQKMKAPSSKNFTILALAYECGFNSKSSFNSIFKKHEGITPSEYLKKM